jgi:hypothetical protein
MYCDIKKEKGGIMADHNTPDWLLETQNKSWEPEIIISGITLTLLFLLPQHIYNFCAMLIQDHGVLEILGRSYYLITMTILTGLKIILIIHLILRGYWTGLIGLSYVFPHGVKRENLMKAQQQAIFEKPEDMVIRIEKTCSLLFSFIFPSFLAIFGVLLVFVPVTLLYFTGLDRGMIRTLTLTVVLPVVTGGVVIFTFLLATKLKDSELSKRIERFSLSQILMIYFTNIGRIRMVLMFALYFGIIFALNSSNISNFSFRNMREIKQQTHAGVITENRDQYENTRDQRFRVQRATLDTNRVTEKEVNLFVACYKGDEYTVKMMRENPSLRKKAGISVKPDDLWIQNLYTVLIDDVPVSGIQWCFTQHPKTGQSGFSASIPLEGVTTGFHELRIGKQYWRVSKKELMLLKTWALIPFKVNAVVPEQESRKILQEKL